MARTLTIGGETEFSLLPEAPRVKLFLKSIETSQYSASVDRWCFVIDDPDYEGGDSEEVDEAIRTASEDQIELFVSVNLPKTPKLGKGTKLYKYLAGMNGGDLDEDSEVDLDAYVEQHYFGDIEVVDKYVRLEDGSFRPGKDENGRPMKKNTVSKLRPIQKRRAGGKATKAPKPAPSSIPDDDSDLDEDEVE